MPPEIIERSIGTPSLFAKIGADKLRRGLPLFRLEEILKATEARIDRGTMSRWLESIGGNLRCTVKEGVPGSRSRGALRRARSQ